MATNNLDLLRVARELAERYALELRAEIQRLDSNYQARIADANGREGLELLKQYCLERFDSWAKALLVTSISSDTASINPLYAQYLDKTEEKTFEFLSTVVQNFPPDLRGDVISSVNLKLSSRKLHWLAHATTEHLKSHPAPVLDLRGIAELQARGNPGAAAAPANPEQPPQQGAPGQLAGDMPPDESGGESSANRSEKTDPTDEQVAAVERKVQQQADLSIREAAAYLRCTVQHVRRLARQGTLIASNTVPKRITSQSLKSYKWRPGNRTDSIQS